MGDFSIFVQRFTSSDRLSGSAVQLEATGKTDGADATPKITAVGTAGDFVVTWSGVDSAGDTSIFVQTFHANGNINGNAVQLEAIGKTDGADLTPEIAAVGTDGEFVVTWSGVDSGGDASIFVQKFHANGMISANSAVQLEAISRTNGADLTPQVMAVGSAGEYVVTWSGVDSSAGGDSSIFVQKFHANGTIIANSLVQLEATGKMNGIDIAPQVLNLGSDGEYVVLWQGSDTGNDASIFVRKFSANGTPIGNSVLLEGIGRTNAADIAPQATVLGSGGEFVVTWSGVNFASERKIFVKRFFSNGEINGSTVQLASGDPLVTDERDPQITALGTAGEFVVVWTGSRVRTIKAFLYRSFCPMECRAATG